MFVSAEPELVVGISFLGLFLEQPTSLLVDFFVTAQELWELVFGTLWPASASHLLKRYSSGLWLGCTVLAP
jgi:hypothetical protein